MRFYIGNEHEPTTSKPQLFKELKIFYQKIFKKGSDSAATCICRAILMKLNATPLSMVNPSTDSMLKQTHSRYALVVLASKRARELLSGKPCRVENRATKFVTNAMEEINEGKISYTIKD